MYRVGVFDSGVGGRSVANAIQVSLPATQVTFVNDSKNVPYGTKSPERLFELVAPILHDLANRADLIVIACNTVSTTLLERLRAEITVPLVGVEPMVEPAVELTKSNTIAICATPATLASVRYKELKSSFATGVNVQEPDCSDWASMIETDQLDRYNIYTRINEVCELGADVIVLGCTHYHWIEDVIKETADGRAQVIQPEQMIVEEVKRVLLQLA